MGSSKGADQNASELVPSDIVDGITVICLTGVLTMSFMRGDFLNLYFYYKRIKRDFPPIIFVIH